MGELVQFRGRRKADDQRSAAEASGVGICPTSSGCGGVQAPAFQPSVESGLANHPTFEQNVGQVDNSVSFLSHSFGYTLAVSPTSVTLQTGGFQAQEPTTVSLNFVGANQDAKISGV